MEELEMMENQLVQVEEENEENCAYSRWMEKISYIFLGGWNYKAGRESGHRYMPLLFQLKW